MKQQVDGTVAHRLYWAILKASRSNKVFRVAIDVAAYLFYEIFRRWKTFTFHGETFRYFYHPYNRTVAGERVVEIPIVKRMLDRHEDERVLEVGNVMSHYFDVKHDVVDKYEAGPGVVNEDVVDFDFGKEYDLIVSVSTMEHVGFGYGEDPDPEKFVKGIANIKRHLAKGGNLVVTVPVHYNRAIDERIRTGTMPFSEDCFMKRISFLNEWRETTREDALDTAAYDGHFANANVLYIGFYSEGIPDAAGPTASMT